MTDLDASKANEAVVNYQGNAYIQFFVVVMNSVHIFLRYGHFRFASFA